MNPAVFPFGGLRGRFLATSVKIEEIAEKRVRFRLRLGSVTNALLT
jgi:hypothetical protein